jgi:DNA-binding transcriptional LysR family regulator
MMRHLDPDALAALAAVVDCGGFTAAADKLGRSQAAVSVKIANLEAQIGRRLVTRGRRGAAPTDAGEVLLAYARRILALQEEALGALGGEALEGHVRLGIPDDYLDTVATPLLGRFLDAYPKAQIEVRCDLSVRLERALRDGEIDLAVITRDPERPTGELLRREPLVWCASAGHRPEERRPLPLALFSEECRSRPAILAALDAAGIPWRVTYTSSHVPGVQSAVAAGIAVTALVESTILPHWRRLGAAEGLPPLRDNEIGMVVSPAAGALARRLARALREGLTGAPGATPLTAR